MSLFKKKEKKHTAAAGLRIAVLLLIVLFTVITVIQNRSLVVTNYKICSSKLPANFAGLRIVQLSDIHLVRTEEQGEALSSLTLAQSPDLVVITGDLTDSHNYSDEEYNGLTLALCRELCSRVPVYFVYGNHEMVLLDDPEKNAFKCSLEECGVRILNNSRDVVEKDGQKFNLLGVMDPATLFKDPVYANSNKTITILGDLTAEIDRSMFTVTLAHRPEFFDVYTEMYGLDLTLSGHAHGGQFRIPFLDLGLYAPNQGFFPEYTAGVYESGGCRMIVSRGIGPSAVPVRIFNPPEIVVVDILGE